MSFIDSYKRLEKLCNEIYGNGVKSYIEEINYFELNDLSADLNNILYYYFTSNQYDGKVDYILALVRGSKDKYEFFDKIETLKTDCGIEE